MRQQVAYACKQHPDRFDCPDCHVNYNERRNSYGLIILNEAGGGTISIAYCPCCGAKLPEPAE